MDYLIMISMKNRCYQFLFNCSSHKKRKRRLRSHSSSSRKVMTGERAIRKENTTMLNTRTAVTAVTAQVLVIPAALNAVGVRKRRERKRDNTTRENTTRSKRSKRQKENTTRGTDLRQRKISSLS